MLGLPLWEVVIQSTLLCRNTGALKPSVEEGKPIMGSDQAMTFNGPPAWGVHSIYTRYDFNRSGEKLKTITNISNLFFFKYREKWHIIYVVEPKSMHIKYNVTKSQVLSVL